MFLTNLDVLVHVPDHQASSPELKVLQVVAIADRITQKMQLRKLGGLLNIEEHIVEAFLTDEGKITDSAYGVLGSWRKRFGDDRKAFEEIKQALLAMGEEKILKEALNVPPN